MAVDAAGPRGPNRLAELRRWRTPASPYPASGLGRAEIVKERRGARAYYWAEGVRANLYYRYADACDVTALKIGGRVWMTDEPPYVWSLASFAERSRGRVLVAGLGLGIVVHQLCENPAVDEVVVVEREQDVWGLVGPLLPRDARVGVQISDFYDWLEGAGRRGWFPDTVIWDLAVWSSRERAGAQAQAMLEVAPRVAEALSPVAWDGSGRPSMRPGWPRDGVRVFVHGLDRDPEGEAFVKTEEFRRAREAVSAGQARAKGGGDGR